MTYNVHSCIGMDGMRSYSRIASVIAEAQPDVVALQELDVSRPRSRNAHQVRVLAEMLEMEFHFHPALRIKEEEYGDAILSKHPVRMVQARPLPPDPPPWKLEPRGALWVNVNVAGVEWQIINTHFGLTRMERLLQAAAIVGPEWMGKAAAGRPLAICGDFNTRIGSPVQRIFQEKLVNSQTARGGRVAPTFSTSFPMLCLDYIFVNEAVKVVDSEVFKGKDCRMASDHYPLVADLAAK